MRFVGLRMAPGAGKQVRWCSYFLMIVVCEEHAANTTDREFCSFLSHTHELHPRRLSLFLWQDTNSLRQLVSLSHQRATSHLARTQVVTSSLLCARLFSSVHHLCPLQVVYDTLSVPLTLFVLRLSWSEQFSAAAWKNIESASSSHPTADSTHQRPRHVQASTPTPTPTLTSTCCHATVTKLPPIALPQRPEAKFVICGLAATAKSPPLPERTSATVASVTAHTTVVSTANVNTGSWGTN
jgi:hypothetical protein